MLKISKMIIIELGVIAFCRATFQKLLTNGTKLVCIRTNRARIFWQEKAAHFHDGRKPLHAG